MNTREKTVQRLLLLLKRGPATMTPAAHAGQLLLDGGDRGTLSVPQAMLEAARAAGLVAVDGETVRRADAARDFLTAPAPQFAPPVADGRAGEAVMVNLAESPLALLRQRRNRKGEPFLSAAEFAAGERLRADYTRGQIMPRLGVNWMAAGASGGKRGAANGIADMTDAALGARERVERAIEAVGPDLSGVLIDICCFLKGLELVEAERGWPARSAKVMLKTALAALARHYEPPRAVRRAPVLHWGAQDYRPSIRRAAT